MPVQSGSLNFGLGNGSAYNHYVYHPTDRVLITPVTQAPAGGSFDPPIIVQRFRYRCPREHLGSPAWPVPVTTLYASFDPDNPGSTTRMKIRCLYHGPTESDAALRNRLEFQITGRFAGSGNPVTLSILSPVITDSDIKLVQLTCYRPPSGVATVAWQVGIRGVQGLAGSESLGVVVSALPLASDPIGPLYIGGPRPSAPQTRASFFLGEISEYYSTFSSGLSSGIFSTNLYDLSAPNLTVWTGGPSFEVSTVGIMLGSSLSPSFEASNGSATLTFIEPPDGTVTGSTENPGRSDTTRLAIPFSYAMNASTSVLVDLYFKQIGYASEIHAFFVVSATQQGTYLSPPLATGWYTIRVETRVVGSSAPPTNTYLLRRVGVGSRLVIFGDGNLQAVYENSNTALPELLGEVYPPVLVVSPTPDGRMPGPIRISHSFSNKASDGSYGLLRTIPEPDYEASPWPLRVFNRFCGYACAEVVWLASTKNTLFEWISNARTDGATGPRLRSELFEKVKTKLSQAQCFHYHGAIAPADTDTVAQIADDIVSFWQNASHPESTVTLGTYRQQPTYETVPDSGEVPVAKLLTHQQAVKDVAAGLYPTINPLSDFHCVSCGSLVVRGADLLTYDAAYDTVKKLTLPVTNNPERGIYSFAKSLALAVFYRTTSSPKLVNVVLGVNPGAREFQFDRAVLPPASLSAFYQQALGVEVSTDTGATWTVLEPLFAKLGGSATSVFITGPASWDSLPSSALQFRYGYGYPNLQRIPSSATTPALKRAVASQSTGAIYATNIPNISAKPFHFITTNAIVSGDRQLAITGAGS